MSTSDILRVEVEGIADYHLRLARLAEYRRLIEALTVEAEEIKAHDLPLLFVRTITRVYTHRGHCEVGCHILVREDAPVSALERIDGLSRDRRGRTRMVTLGNDVTPHRRYWYTVSDFTGTEISGMLRGLMGPTAEIPGWDAAGKRLDF